MAGAACMARTQPRMHALIRHALLQEGPVGAPGTAYRCQLCVRKDWLCQNFSAACDASPTCPSRKRCISCKHRDDLEAVMVHSGPGVAFVPSFLTPLNRVSPGCCVPMLRRQADTSSLTSSILFPSSSHCVHPPGNGNGNGTPVIYTRQCTALVKRYTIAEASADAGFYETIVQEAMDLEADAMLGCDFKDGGTTVARLMGSQGYHPKALWLTVAPAHADFMTALDEEASEHTLSAGQWHPTFPSADPLHGTASEYSAAFQQAYGQLPSYVAAGASATSFSLAKAVQAAFDGCSFLDQDLDADRLLFDASAIECEGSSGNTATTGYERVLDTLLKQTLDTFFGEVRSGPSFAHMCLCCVCLRARLPCTLDHVCIACKCTSTLPGHAPSCLTSTFSPRS
eukprot:1158138-Pelagomonas_calceolata.AAC.2